MTSRRYIALLRGINVGRAKRVAMADLRQLIGQLGFTQVRSLQNSGNVVFSGTPASVAAADQSIEEALVIKLGVAARVTVMDSEELGALIDANPLLTMATDHTRLLAFIVGDDAALAGVAPLAEQNWAPEALAIGPRAAYVWCPAGLLDCHTAGVLERLLGDGVTSREWHILAKLHRLCLDPVAPV